MQASDLMQAFRQRANDIVEPYLYEDDDLLRWASEAEREACIRADLIFDRTKPTVCLIPVVAGITSYQMNPLITKVAATRLDRALQYPGWRCHWLNRVDQSNAWKRVRRCRDYGNDIGFTDDYGLGTRLAMYSVDGNTLQIYGTPDDTFLISPFLSYLRLEVYRLPLEDMSGPEDEPEIPVMHQDGLVDWMLYRAFTGVSADEEQTRRGALAMQTFTQRYGDRPSANQMRMQAEGRSWRTPYGGL